MFLAWRRTRRTKSMSFFSVAGFTGWPFLVCAFERVSAQGQQELRVDVGDLHALEVRLQQRPFLPVVAALPFRHLAQLVGVLEEGLGASRRRNGRAGARPCGCGRAGRDTSRSRSWWRRGASARRWICWISLALQEGAGEDDRARRCGAPAGACRRRAWRRLRWSSAWRLVPYRPEITIHSAVFWSSVVKFPTQIASFIDVTGRRTSLRGWR